MRGAQLTGYYLMNVMIGIVIDIITIIVIVITIIIILYCDSLSRNGPTVDAIHLLTVGQ